MTQAQTIPPRTPASRVGVARLLSIGTAAPERTLSRDEAVEMSEILGTTRSSAVRALHRRSGVDSRRIVADREKLYGAGAPTTAARLASYTDEASRLAHEAGGRALNEAGVEPGAVTHVVTVSCTGMESPGFDQRMIASRGLPDSVRRTHVGFMGCHAAINGLAAAAAYAEADPEAVVLLCCVELCSLHYHFSDRSDQMVANAIFADGAAAAVIGQGGDGPALTGFGSKLFGGTESVMGWVVGDHGFEMTLGAEAPDLLRQHVPGWLDSLLAGHGLVRDDIGGWAIHPGGPRIVRAVIDGLGLPDAAGEISMDVLRTRGNMSSPTVLFVLREMWRRGTARPWLGAAFGPGLAGEAVLLT